MDGAERSQAIGRRKACDVCHVRKIKCDAKKPACSHCILYKAKCTFTPQLQKRRKKDNKGPQNAPKDIVGLEDRLSRVEAKLRQNNRGLSKETNNGVPRPKIKSPDRMYPVEDVERDGVVDDMWWCLATDLTSEDITPAESPVLPPFHEVDPLIENYFANVNSAMPLFDEDNFKSILLAWYADSSSRTTTQWAAISVVIALSLWHDPSQKSPDLDNLMRQCIRNAQSILKELHMQNYNLLELQVVLGLVMLFQAGPNPHPAALLVATAVKMAHRLRLHTKRHWEVLGGSGASQRNRVFWILYVLERDFSMRLREPYLLQEIDMDVDLPEFTTPDDNAGIVIANDGNTWLNFLLCRIDIARIQAKIYDLKYSVQGEKLAEAGQEGPVREHLQSMLRDWKQSIPPQFQPDMLSDGTSLSGSARYLAMLYFIYYTCLYQVHGLYSHDSEWIRRLTTHSERYANGYEVHEEPRDVDSPLTSTWEEDFESSRECMRLFQGVDPNDLALLGVTSCTYISALLILLANKLTARERRVETHLESDDILIKDGIAYVGRMGRAINDERLQKLYQGCCELSSRATTAYLGTGTIEKPTMTRALLWPTLSDFYDSFAIGDVYIEDYEREKGSKGVEPALAAWPSNVASLADLTILGV